MCRHLAKISRFKFQTAKRHRPRAAARVGLLVLSPLFEGRRDAERRILVTAAACFPDCRKTEAHGNAFQRPAAAFFKTSVRSSGDLAHDDFAPLPVPVQPHQWQGPVVSPDGNPRPPDAVGANHSRRRRIRPAWVTPPRPSFRSVPLQSALEKRPSLDRTRAG
jgi:hypothetical protein